MANTQVKQNTTGLTHEYVFSCTSAAGATETFQLPAGARVLGCSQCVFVGTARTATGYSYVQSTGVLTVSGLTASDVFTITVWTD